jgi:hypothetical protein
VHSAAGSQNSPLQAADGQIFQIFSLILEAMNLLCKCIVMSNFSAANSNKESFPPRCILLRGIVVHNC